MKLRSGLSKPPAKRELVPLTQQNLQAFDGKAISNKGNSEIASFESIPSSVDPMFPTLLQQRGVYFKYPDVCPPNDLDAIRKVLQKKRLERDIQQTQAFFQRLKWTYNEEVYKSHFLNFIFNPPTRTGSDKYSAQMDIEWTRIKDFDINNELPNPKPDYFESFSIEQYSRNARRALGWYLIPSAHPITMPANLNVTQQR
jgi:hypothetical protein